jgi:hypothetical protein
VISNLSLFIHLCLYHKNYRSIEIQRSTISSAVQTIITTLKPISFRSSHILYHLLNKKHRLYRILYKHLLTPYNFTSSNQTGVYLPRNMKHKFLAALFTLCRLRENPPGISSL